MAITDQLLALGLDKSKTRDAILAKGGTCPETHGFDNFPADIATIPTGLKVKYFVISLTEATKKLPVEGYFELDFEPKGVYYINVNAAQLIRQHLPSITDKTVRGYVLGSLFSSTIAEGMQYDMSKRAFVTTSEVADSPLVNFVGTPIPMTYTYNELTGKYDTIIGTTDPETLSFVYRFIGWQGALDSELLFFG